MTSKQDYEEVAAHDAQRGVDPYDGIDDHDGQLWHTCKDQIKDALATWSRRAKKITLGEQDAITQANIIIEANCAEGTGTQVQRLSVLRKERL